LHAEGGGGLALRRTAAARRRVSAAARRRVTAARLVLLARRRRVSAARRRRVSAARRRRVSAAPRRLGVGTLWCIGLAQVPAQEGLLPRLIRVEVVDERLVRAGVSGGGGGGSRGEARARVRG
jgi:hypothetical protein